MPVTLRQIAEQVGLSAITVSRILGGKGDRHSPETRRRVLTAARRLGYRPNTAARAISTGRFGCIALLLSADRFFGRLTGGLMAGIQDVLEDRNMHLTVARLTGEKLKGPADAPKVLREWTSDGLLLNYHFNIPAYLRDLIRASRIPAVWINSKHPADCAYPDDFEAGRLAAGKLLEAGHRRIAYVDYSVGADQLGEAHYSAVDREAGCLAALREAGLGPRSIRPQNKHQLVRLGREGFSRRWLQASDRPTGIVTYGDSVACAVMVAARGLGLRIPEDLSVVTCADEPVVSPGYRVDTMLVPQRPLGRAAAEMLLEKVDRPDHDLEPRAVPFGYKAGVTIAPPPAD